MAKEIMFTTPKGTVVEIRLSERASVEDCNVGIQLLEMYRETLTSAGKAGDE